MPLNMLGLVTGMAVAQKAGVDQSQIGRVALPAAFFPNLALGVIVADRLARTEASREAAESASRTTAALSAPAATAGANVSGAPTTPVSGATITETLPQPLSLPTISEVPAPAAYKPGDVLRVDMGVWQGVPVAQKPTLQWFRNGENINGANEATYTVTQQDQGHSLSVQVK